MTAEYHTRDAAGAAGAARPAQGAENTHTLTLLGRRELLLTGVLDVDQYDEHMITVHTKEGILTIEGDGLHIKRLTLENGELSLDGRIVVLSYTEEAKAQAGGGGFFARLFR